MNYERGQEWLLRLHREVLTDSEIEPDDDEGSLIDDHIETIEDTESEEEFDNEQNLLVPEEQEMQAARIPCFIGKNGTTRWRKYPATARNVRTRAENIVTHLPGPKGDIRHKNKASEIWECFLSANMLEKIVTYTNKFIEMQAYDVSQNRSFRPTDLLEVKALLGLLYISGASKNSRRNAEDLFRTNGMAMDIFRLTMSRIRFQFLLKHIRFDDKATRQERVRIDKLAPIREIYDEFVLNLSQHYNMSAYTTIDEKLEAFRGKCPFRVYMPKKPNRYGIKIYALVDSKMFYTAKLEVYVGKQPVGPFQCDTSNLALVPRLCSPILGSNRNVTFDNFFTSVPITEVLKQHRLTTIGTLRKNKSEIPPQMLLPRPEKSIMFAFRDKCTLVSYTPKRNRNVLLLSTMHYDDGVDRKTGKPDIIMDYNKTKGGVDVVDKMCEAYNCARATRRWPMVIFYSALNVAGINSYIIYNSNNQTKINRRKFLENLGFQLLDPHIRRRAQQQTIPRIIRSRLSQMCGIETNNVVPQNQTHGRCTYCSTKKSRRTKYSCRKCKKYLCLEHLSGLCRDCYEDYEPEYLE